MQPNFQIFSLIIYLKTLFKTRQQAQNVVAYAKPHITKPRLSFGSPRNRNLSQSVRDHQNGISWVICPINTCHPLKESNIATTDQLFYFIFAYYIVLVSVPFCVQNLLPWIAFQSSFLSVRLDAAYFMNH